MTTDDEPTETLIDNAVEVEWDDDDVIELPESQAASETERLGIALTQALDSRYDVEIRWLQRMVVLTRTTNEGDSLSVHESARSMTLAEAIDEARRRLDDSQFDSLRTRRRHEKRYWPVLICTPEGVDVELWESPPTTSVKGSLYGPGCDTYQEACEWLVKKIDNWAAQIHDDCPSIGVRTRRIESASDARQKVLGMLAAWDEMTRVGADWDKAGGF